jgi:predicted RNase H-like HicB family nuclease
MTRKRTFEVMYEREDNGSWFVHCIDLQGAHSHGRTLASARENIREAIAIVLNLEDNARIELSEDIRLRDAVLQHAIEKAASQRADAQKIQLLATQATKEALSECMGGDDALSNRDLAELLGLSHQRVQQLVSDLISDA